MIGRWFRQRRTSSDCCGALPDTTVCPARTLDDLEPGARFRVRCLKGGGGIRQRLLDAGILPGAEAIVLRTAPLHDPIEIRIGDTFVTLRRTEALMVGIDDA